MDQPENITQRDVRFMKVFSVVTGILASILAVWIFADLLVKNIQSW